MLSARWWRAIGIGVPVITAIVLLGISQVFDIGISTNLFQTGITPAIVLGIANIILAIAIYKNRV